MTNQPKNTSGAKPAVPHKKNFLDDRRIRLALSILGAIVAWMIVTGRIGIRYCGCELVPMIEPVSGTVGFVDAKQIMPVADEIRKSGYFKYCARKMASGGRYYVIKDGMVVRGAVLPVKLEPLAKSGLRELADMVKKTRDVADVEDLSEQEDKNDA